MTNARWALAALVISCSTGCAAAAANHGSGYSSVLVQNLTGRDVCGVFVSHAGQEAYGPELLGVAQDRENIIAGNESEDISVRPGTYDVRVQNCDGRTFVQRNVAMQAEGRVILDPPH